MSYYEYGFFNHAKLISVEGGIKAQLKAGKTSLTWWGEKWINALEQTADYGRLSRGRTYARKGQVMNINIAKGFISAKVQGSRPKPYKVEISVDTISKENWKKIAKALSGKIYYAAKLMAGIMPNDIEEEFQSKGLSLFPYTKRSLKTSCSCPDWGDPCKHIAAVHYITGAEFDRDPFLIFKLKGIERDDFLDMLAVYGDGIVAMKLTSDEPLPEDVKPEYTPQPLSAVPSSFWGDSRFHAFGGQDSLPEPELSAAVPVRLGDFPFWQGDVPFMEVFETIYQNASDNAMSKMTKVIAD
jgi:uncharacterized Zn finger protein